MEDELYFGDAFGCASNLKNDFELNNKTGDEHISTRELKLEFGVRAELKLKAELGIIMKRQCNWRATQPCKPACTHKCEAKFKSKRAFRFGVALHMDFGVAPGRMKSKSKFLVGRVDHAQTPQEERSCADLVLQALFPLPPSPPRGCHKACVRFPGNSLKQLVQLPKNLPCAYHWGLPALLQNLLLLEALGATSHAQLLVVSLAPLGAPMQLEGHSTMQARMHT